MRIYVDAAVHQWRGQLWCHMFSPNIGHLHAFAARIGMRPEWFQDPRTTKSSWPHFDLPAWRRERALAMGAIAVDRYQTVALSRVALNCFNGTHGTPEALDPLEALRKRNSPRLAQVEQWLDEELKLLGLCRPAALAA